MSIDKVREYFKKYGKDKDILEFNHSSATVSDASIAIGCSDADIAKTLSFLVNEKPILIVMAGDKKVDNHKYRSIFNEKAKMIPSDMLNSLVGHDAGGVCPFAICDGVLVYLDISLQSHQYIYPACGSSNSAIKLSIDELMKFSNFSEWVDVTK